MAIVALMIYYSMLTKLWLDDQSSIFDYALLTLVNTLMNDEVFSSRVTTARWERNYVHIGRGLRQCNVIGIR